MVGYVIYGRGSFDQLDEIIAPHRKADAPMVFLVDHYFEDKPLLGRLPVRGNDKVFAADVTYEPKTTYVDELANYLKDQYGMVSGIIGIGGRARRAAQPNDTSEESTMMTTDSSPTRYRMLPVHVIEHRGDAILKRGSLETRIGGERRPPSGRVTSSRTERCWWTTRSGISSDSTIRPCSARGPDDPRPS